MRWVSSVGEAASSVQEKHLSFSVPTWSRYPALWLDLSRDQILVSDWLPLCVELCDWRTFLALHAGREGSQKRKTVIVNDVLQIEVVLM